MTKLLDAVAEAGVRLETASEGRVALDPRRTLSRAGDLDLAPPGRMSPNRHARLIECSDGWLAVSLARPDDIDLLPAWIGSAPGAEPWEALAAAARRRPVDQMLASAIDLHLPAAKLAEAAPLPPASLDARGASGREVVDLSALWAGPLCGGLLAEAGFEVTKIDGPARPDPTPRHAPGLDARLNGKKRILRVSPGSAEAMEAITRARILITATRAHALARLGISEASLFARNPDLLWIAITAHGWRGDGAMRVGFGDDCAAAGGLVGQSGDGPVFLGDALADPLTGITAATLALEAVAAGRSGLLDVSLAGTAARFAAAVN